MPKYQPRISPFDIGLDCFTNCYRQFFQNDPPPKRYENDQSSPCICGKNDTRPSPNQATGTSPDALRPCREGEIMGPPWEGKELMQLCTAWDYRRREAIARCREKCKFPTTIPTIPMYDLDPAGATGNRTFPLREL